MRKVSSKAVYVWLLFSSILFFFLHIEARAEESLLTRETAIHAAIANSDEYAKLESELALKEVELVQAVKTIKLKQKNMSTFRWSPLLNFKFPEQANLEEEYEFQFKPVQLEAEIDVLEHKLLDQKLATRQETATLYTDIVVAEKYIEFYESRIEELEKRLARTRLEVKTGNRSQNDAETLEEKIKTLNSTLASKQNELMNAKKELSKLCGMDITVGYRFEEDFAEVSLDRKQLPTLISHTLDKDISYYETCMNATTQKISLETNYQLMEKQYQDKMGYISDFVKSAMNGEKVNNKAFKEKYDEFLKAIDAPWEGSINLLFLKIPKEWFKGEISGIRYVEDSSYSLFEASLSYLDALQEKENHKAEIEQTVEAEYNNVISLQKAYLTAKEQIRKSETALDKDGILLRLGELTEDEYIAAQDEHEEIQIEMLELLGEYSNSIYAFDRLTCGAVSELMQISGVNKSTVEGVYAKGACYYMESLIQEQEFRLGVSIPQDFPLEITHFELWCNNTRIGEKTAIDSTIRHLKLAVEDVETVKIRFYNGEEFVDDCLINPEEPSGALSILKEYTVEKTEDTTVGSYSYEMNPFTGMVTISLETKALEKIAYYRILNSEGKAVGGMDKLSIEKPFSYLGLLMDSLDELTLEFYDEGEGLLYRGYFDSVNTLLKREEATDE